MLTSAAKVMLHSTLPYSMTARGGQQRSRACRAHAGQPRAQCGPSRWGLTYDEAAGNKAADPERRAGREGRHDERRSRVGHRQWHVAVLQRLRPALGWLGNRAGMPRLGVHCQRRSRTSRPSGRPRTGPARKRRLAISTVRGVPTMVATMPRWSIFSYRARTQVRTWGVQASPAQQASC
jgi:hypothetical protein